MGEEEKLKNCAMRPILLLCVGYCLLADACKFGMSLMQRKKVCISCYNLDSQSELRQAIFSEVCYQLNSGGCCSPNHYALKKQKSSFGNRFIRIITLLIFQINQIIVKK